MSNIRSPFAKEEKVSAAKTFEQHYNSSVRPLEQFFEKKRIAALKKRKRNFFGVVIFGFILAAVLFIFTVANHRLEKGEDSEELVVILAVGLVVVVHFLLGSKVKYSDHVKQEIFPRIFSFFSNFHYSHEVPIDLRKWQSKSRIVPNYAIAELEDYVVGDIDGVSLEMFQARLIMNSPGLNKYGNDEKQVFHGSFIFISMNKNFSGNTIVKSVKKVRALKRVSKKMRNFLTQADISDLQRVRLESDQFERQFDVYSCDQVQARYILTTTFMERISDLANMMEASLQMSFFDNHLLIALETNQDLFKINSQKEPVDFRADAKLIIEEIENLKEIVQVLKLNQRTGI